MSTVGEVKELGRSVNIIMDLFGKDAGFEEEYHQRMKNIGRTICEEHGISVEEGPTIPPETELGPEAAQEFQSLKEWLAENHCLI